MSLEQGCSDEMSLGLLAAGMQPPEAAVRVIGIDLGTTNCTVCELVWPAGAEKPEAARCLAIDQETTQGRYTHVLVPSVVALRENGVWVGEGAKRLRALPGAGMEEYRTWFAETKNDMGIRRTYHRAPAGYRSARSIAGEILRFLYQAAREDSAVPISRVVVTVPASFQASQRQDTLDAAQRAGIEVAGGDLLDEPVAAFLAYFFEHASGSEQHQLLPENGEKKHLVVFDFGGGTCDVAVLQLGRDDGGKLTVHPVTVSRYHRLGGGDIDRAVVHEVLIPQLAEQNEIELHSLGFEEKRQYLQPALLGIAEALKQKLSIEIVRLQKFGKWGPNTDKSSLVQTHPGVHPVALKDRTLTIQNPKLSAAAFEKLLEPFLDRDLMNPREDDYRTTCSIFAPLEDALLRGQLEAADVDLCLLAGGSSLIPQVQEALQRHFENAKILRFPRRDDVQTAIAKGAVYHAMSLARDRGAILKPICHDDICVQTKSGPSVLIPQGEELPFPKDRDFLKRTDILMPFDLKAGQEDYLRIEIVAGSERRRLFVGVWAITGPVRKGDPLCLEFRFDENQILELRMTKEGRSEAFEASVDNPFTHVVNPNSTKARIEEIEERLRTEKLAAEEMAEEFETLGNLYRELRQHEKALAMYARALKLGSEPEAFLLNRMAFCARDLGDRDRADRFFREADRTDPWSGTWFNWALAKEMWGQPEIALQYVAKAIAMHEDPPYYVLQARLTQRLGDVLGGLEIAKQALPRFRPIEVQSDYELSWYRAGARMVGDKEALGKADAATRKRAGRGSGAAPGETDGELPELEQAADADLG